MKPSYLYMCKESFMGNIGVMGSIGSGKTAAVAIPLLTQLLERYPQDIFLINDIKGNLHSKVQLQINGLDKKVNFLSNNSNVKLNLIWHPDLLKEGRFERVADLIKQASLSVLGGGDKSKFWEIQAYNLTKAALCYCYYKKRYFTILDLRKFIIEVNDELLDEFKNGLEKKDIDEEDYVNMVMAEVMLREHVKRASELKSGIVSSVTVFLDLFMEYSLYSMFCPKENEVNISSIEEFLREGSITIIHFASEQVSIAISTFLKILISETKKDMFRKLQLTNTALFIIEDEFQDLAVFSDVKRSASDREFLISKILLFQSISSLVSRLKDAHIVSELLNNIKTKICFNVSDELTQRYFSYIAGEYAKKKVSESFSENSQGATKNLLDDGFSSNQINLGQVVTSQEHKEDYILKGVFPRLSQFEAFVHFFDGVSSSFHKGFFKPNFLPKNISHYHLLKLRKKMLRRLK